MSGILRKARAVVYVRALMSLGHFGIKEGQLVFLHCKGNRRPLPNGLPESARRLAVQSWIRGYEREICQALKC